MGRKNKSQAGTNGVAQDDTVDDGYAQEETKQKEVVAEEKKDPVKESKWEKNGDR